MIDHSSGEHARPAHSDACERNKGHILEVLRATFADAERVLEIGSGTGQHVVHFARHLPVKYWQPTDQQAYLPALNARLRAEAQATIAAPVELDVRMSPWPVATYDGIFSSNTLHYMSVDCVTAFFAGAGQALRPGGALVVYGPFNYQGAYTSSSNAHFDQWLKESDPLRAIRDFEWVDELAAAQAMTLEADIAMPANNRCLVWRSRTGL